MEFIKNEVYETRGGYLYTCTEVHETHAVLESLGQSADRIAVFTDERKNLDKFLPATAHRVERTLSNCQDRIKETEDELKYLREREDALDAARQVVEARDNSNQ